MDEFALIETYFRDIGKPSSMTRLGIGDDGAVIAPPVGCQLVVAMDTLVDGVHFASDATPEDIAYKALTVNLSDLAAMAAEPEWFLLSLTLPHSDSAWLADFANGLRQAATAHGPQLIGGDTSLGPLSVSLQLGGSVPTGQYVTRSGARPGDLVLVSGELGNAALGLAVLRDRLELPPGLNDKAITALHRPRARLELIHFLRRHASAAIDLSDGLIGDLGHILERSHCGARLERGALPVDDWIRRQHAWQYALTGGDDYEICCCLPAKHSGEIEAWNATHSECPLTVIGEITASGYRLHQDDGEIELADWRGYRHFN